MIDRVEIYIYSNGILSRGICVYFINIDNLVYTLGQYLKF